MRYLTLLLTILLGLFGCSGEVQVETTSTSSSGGSGGAIVGGGGSGGVGAGGAGGGGSAPILVGADRPSCAGKDLTCAGQSCCASAFVPGGTYNRLNDPAYPATVSNVYLDVFEVTVGRMRSFVDVYPGSKPQPGAGAHPKVPESGWDESAHLPASQEKLRAILRADGFPVSDTTPFLAWTDEVGANEDRPVTFLTWELAQAFCIWDGGRLPTEAEWNYVAVGGSDQRTYPWGEEPPSPELAALNYNGPSGPYDMGALDVGSLPAGAARWGHLDMNGGRMEVLFDANLETSCCDVSLLPVPCDDCLVMPTNGEDGRVLRDLSAFHLADIAVADVANEYRGAYFTTSQADAVVGFRCVYVPTAD